MRWISVEDGLPEDGTAVLVRYAGDNWGTAHKLADGQTRKRWRWQAALFVRGNDAATAKLLGVYRQEDQDGNNTLPYCWKQFGPGYLFGQDVTHWAAITDPGDAEDDTRKGPEMFPGMKGFVASVMDDYKELDHAVL